MSTRKQHVNQLKETILKWLKNIHNIVEKSYKKHAHY